MAKSLRDIKKSKKSKEIFTALKYFFGLQIFFVLMMIGVSQGGVAVIALIVGGPFVMAFIKGTKQSLVWLFYFIFITFMLGQRTVYVGTYFRIHPSEAMVWALVIPCLFMRVIPAMKGKKIPMSVYLLILSTFVGIVVAELNNLNRNLALFYSKGFWFSLPAFYVCKRLVSKIEDYRNIILILSMGCFFLSFLALAEFFNLGFIGIFGGYLENLNFEGQGDFERLGAAFWGGPMIAAFLLFFIPLSLSSFMVSKSTIQKVLLAASMALSFLVIYFAGFRGIWVVLGAALAIYAYFKGAKGIVILGILICIGSQFIPDKAKSRFSGVFGESKDTSSQLRYGKMEKTSEMILEHPIFGNGWGASGLVHSDYLQLWADAGILAPFSRLAVLLATLLALKRRLKFLPPDKKEYAIGFISSIVSLTLIMVIEPLIHHPELVAPVWLLTALAYQYPNIAIADVANSGNQERASHAT